MNTIKIFIGFIFSAIMLTFIQQPFAMSYLAWIGLLPIIFVCSPEHKKYKLFIIGYLCGAAYWLANLYWLSFPTMIGYISFCLYMGLYLPLIALCIRFVRKKNIPMAIFAPIIFVGAEGWQSWLLGGFSWRLLGHSQYPNTSLIQIADIFGVGGISFLIAMANGAVADLFLYKNWKKSAFGALITVVLISAAVIYGKGRIDGLQSSKMPLSPMIGSVQTNEPMTPEGLSHKADFIFDDLMFLSKRSQKNGAKLIITPETMVVDTLEYDYLQLRGSEYSGYFYDSQIRQFTDENNIYMIAGATGGTTKVENNMVWLEDRTNSAFLYYPDGTVDVKRYDKIHLIPFGEYLPFKNSFPTLFKFLLKLTPYPDDFDFSLKPGENFYVYDITSENQDYKFSVIICYEDTVSDLVRQMTTDAQGRKKIDWLVNISNDGWFTKQQKGGTIIPSTELAQHAVICAFRAIENRVGIVRSVNTGVSCFIDPIGRMKYAYIKGSLPEEPLQRKAISGWLNDKLEIYRQASIFSKIGRWCDYITAILTLPIAILAVFLKD